MAPLWIPIWASAGSKSFRELVASHKAPSLVASGSGSSVVEMIASGIVGAPWPCGGARLICAAEATNADLI